MQNDPTIPTATRAPPRIPPVAWIIGGVVFLALFLACGGAGVGIYFAMAHSTPPGKQIAEGAAKPKQKQVDASKSKTVAHMKVEVLETRIAKLRFYRVAGRLDDILTSKEDLFQISVRVTNISDVKIINYFPFDYADIIRPGAILKDEHGNQYKPWPALFSAPVDRPPSDQWRIDPGKSLDDIVAFDVPLTAAKDLTLTLVLSQISATHPAEKITFKLSR